jgi:hypothetical protein
MWQGYLKEVVRITHDMPESPFSSTDYATFVRRLPFFKGTLVDE